MNEEGKRTAWQEAKEKMLNFTLEERRKAYFCDDFVSLDEIPTWAQSEKDEDKKEETSKIKKELFEDGTYIIDEALDLSSKVSIYQGDITKLEIDAIVNAANNSLLGGGGVDGAIHRGAGKMLLEENRTHGGCEDGEAVVSGGYRLPAKYIISTVGPRGEHPDILRAAYSNCLNKMKENKLKSIAFPCISTGIYGYPNQSACNVALKSVRTFLEKNHQDVERVIFCLFLPIDVGLYKQRMSLMFPSQDDNAD